MPIIDENDFTFTSSDKVTPIHVHEWVPDCDINGVVQICHGINEYMGRYENFARFIASKGFVVVGNDHLGHGKSVAGPEDLGFFAYKDGWEKAVEDVESLRVLTSKKYPNVPYFILGHSMGSFMMRTHMIKFPEAPISGVILSGTGQIKPALVLAGRMACGTVMHREGPRYRSRALVKMTFGTYNKKFEPNRTPFDWLTRDEKIVDAYAVDPFCTFLPSVSMLNEMLGGIAFIQKQENLSKMNKEMPVLFISGMLDPVGDNGVGVIKAYSGFVKADMKYTSYKLYPECRHELLNELNRTDVYNDILDWIFKIENSKNEF